jgi:hypothetical protein
MDFDDVILRLLPFISILLGLGGATLVLLALNRYFNSQDVKNWPKAKGVITHSEVYRQEMRNSQTNTSQVYFGLRCFYDYKVEGNKYSGSNVYFGEKFWMHRDVKKVQAEAAKYPLGADVPIYYNPKNPKIAALEPGVREGAVEGQLILGVIIIVVGIVLFFVSRQG